MVAFSGGADSAFLLAAATDALGERAVAATGVSPSLPERELDDARALAAELGARHLVVATHEGERPGYLGNGPDRCFFCKDELFEVLGPLAGAEGLALAVGTNTDDLGDHRPGQRAAAAHGVLTPLVAAGLSKARGPPGVPPPRPAHRRQAGRGLPGLPDRLRGPGHPGPPVPGRAGRGPAALVRPGPAPGPRPRRPGPGGGPGRGPGRPGRARAPGPPGRRSPRARLHLGHPRPGGLPLRLHERHARRGAGP